MYGRKRKYPSSSQRGQGASKRRFQGAGSYLRAARSGYRSQGRRLLPYRRTASTAYVRQPTGFSDRIFLKLTYHEQVAFTQASGNLADQVYRGNSLFDPDLTGTGGQPMAFNQWEALYGTYTVFGAAIEVTAMASGGTVSNVRFGITPTTTSTAFATGDQERAEELPYTKARSLNMGAASIGQSTLKGYMSAAKMNGMTRYSVQADPNWSALMTANPASQWYWHVWNYCPGADTNDLILLCKLTYFCVLKTRLQISIST